MTKSSGFVGVEVLLQAGSRDPAFFVAGDVLSASTSLRSLGADTSTLTAERSEAKKWAHQDSNLERAGYEPAALTVELWARSIVQQPEHVE